MFISVASGEMMFPGGRMLILVSSGIIGGLWTRNNSKPDGKLPAEHKNTQHEVDMNRIIIDFI